MSINTNDLIAGREKFSVADDLFADAMVFIDRNIQSKIHCFIHLKDSEGIDYCYESGDEISDYDFDSLIADYYDRSAGLPPIEEIIDLVLEGVTGNSAAITEVIEQSEDEMWEYVYQVYGSSSVDDQQEEYDDLVDLLEDLFNYLSVCVTQTSFLKSSEALNYLKCTRTTIEEDKLYLTFQIYADKLFELQESDEGDYLEVVGDIRELIGNSALPTKRHLLRDGLIGGSD